jgi:hypothetical protein
MSRTGYTQIHRTMWLHLDLTCIHTFAEWKEAARKNTFYCFEWCLDHHKLNQKTSGKWTSKHNAVVPAARAFFIRRSIGRLHSTRVQTRSIGNQMCLCSRGEFLRLCQDKKIQIRSPSALDHRYFLQTARGRQQCRGGSSAVSWQHLFLVFPYSKNSSLSKCSKCQFGRGQRSGLPLSCQILRKLDQIRTVRLESFVRR